MRGLVIRRRAYRPLCVFLTLVASGAMQPALPKESQVQVAQLTCVLPVPSEKLGASVTSFYPVSGGALVWGHHPGLIYRFEHALGRLSPIGNQDTGAIYTVIELLPDSILFSAERGHYRYDFATRDLRRVSERPETAKHAVVHHAASVAGGLLLWGQDGLYRSDSNASKLVPVDFPQTEIMDVLPLSNGALINARNGLYRLDLQSGLTSRVGPDGPHGTGGFTAIRPIPGGALVDGATVQFRYDFNLGDVRPAGPPMGHVAQSVELSGGLLYGADKGLFRFDSRSRELRRIGDLDGAVYFLHSIPGGFLVGRYEGLFRYDEAAELLQELGPSKLTRPETVAVVPGGVLVGAANGVFRFDTEAKQVTRVGPVMAKWASKQRPFPGGVLVFTGQGLLRYDSDSRKAELVELPGVRLNSHGSVNGGAVFALEDGGILHYDAASGKVTRHALAGRGGIGELFEIPGGVLIRAERGWAYFDAASNRLLMAGTHEVPAFQSRPVVLPTGGLLMAGNLGDLAYMPAQPLERSNFAFRSHFKDWVPQKGRREVQVQFEHPCALVADAMDLSLHSFRRGSESAATASPIRFAESSADRSKQALLGADVDLQMAGEWTLQLRRGSELLAEAQFTLDRQPLLQRVQSAWQTVLAGLSVLYAALFVGLLLLTRRTSAALRALTDGVWAKSLGWPFFFLRQVPVVQSWVLEPWFQAVRESILRAPLRPYLDPPVSSTDTETEVRPALTLLSSLPSLRRIWLQGRAGMGKSTVTEAWDRAFFADPECPTLAQAVRKYGFILITVPVRHYSALESPDAKSPEGWVIDAVRRRLEHYGMPLDDSATLRAMLRSGKFAIALDGVNEANRSDAIGAFERQFNMVLMIATSQTAPPEGWCLWRLPRDIEDQRAGLLRLWLGDDAGNVLERRLLASGGVGVIVSGYDLRLIADLARNDPAASELPQGRVALYRAVLNSAERENGEPIHLARLRLLALQMILDGRREFSSTEARDLGEGVADALSKEQVRVIRRTGASWEFRHDQMRAFLAASSLIEDMPAIAQVTDLLKQGKFFRLSRADQESLWAFVAALLPDEAVATLWNFAQEDPGSRGLLQAALQVVADERRLELRRPRHT